MAGKKRTLYRPGSGKKAGTPKVPGSGRKKGTGNKINPIVQQTLERLGCDPIKGMAIIALDAMQTAEEVRERMTESCITIKVEERTQMGKDVLAYYTLAGSMFKELTQYVSPKKKAIEISGSLNGNLIERLNDARSRRHSE
jgi:hypothetical protein